MNTRIALFVTTLLASTLSAGASAADPVSTIIIANEGIGFSRMEDSKVIAYDAVAAYENNQILVADCAAHKADYKNVTWCFTNAENGQLFQAAANRFRQLVRVLDFDTQ